MQCKFKTYSWRNLEHVLESGSTSLVEVPVAVALVSRKSLNLLVLIKWAGPSATCVLHPWLIRFSCLGDKQLKRFSIFNFACGCTSPGRVDCARAGGSHDCKICLSTNILRFLLDMPVPILSPKPNQNQLSEEPHSILQDQKDPPGLQKENLHHFPCTSKANLMEIFSI